MGPRGEARAHVVHSLSARADDLDRRIIDTAAAHRSDWATDVANATMFVGTTPAVLAATCVAVALIAVVLHAYRPALVAGASLVLATVAAGLLKSVFERPRPPADLALASTSGYSFPSTQASETSAIAAGLIFLLLLGPGWGRRLTTWVSGRAMVGVVATLVAAVVFVGVCMVYLGAHWPTDVVAGWLLGTVIGVTVAGIGSRVGRGQPSVDDERRRRAQGAARS